MKKFLIVTSFAMFLGVTTGCQSGWRPWRSGCGTSAPAPVISTPIYGEAPSSSCGPGCNSCGSSTIPSFASVQAYAPAPASLPGQAPGPIPGQ
jgi:hypothetical protein